MIIKEATIILKDIEFITNHNEKDTYKLGKLL